jgi:hypothetical protein
MSEETERKLLGGLPGRAGRDRREKGGSFYRGTRTAMVKLSATRGRNLSSAIHAYGKKTNVVRRAPLRLRGEALFYAGRAVTGFTESGMRALEKKFESFKRESPPLLRRRSRSGAKR